MIAKLALYEFLSIVRRWPYFVSAVGLPIFAAVLLSMLGNASRSAISDQTNDSENPIGIFDETQVITSNGGVLASARLGESKRMTLQPDGQAEEDTKNSVRSITLLRVRDVDSGISAIRSGGIGALVHIPADYLTSGEIFLYTLSESMFNEQAKIGALVWSEALLRQKGLNDHEIARVRDDLHVIQRLVGTSGRALTVTRSHLMQRLLAPLPLCLVLMVSIYVALSMTSDRFLEDRQTRALEVILCSVRASQYLLGKLLGIFAAAVLQTVIWAFLSWVYISMHYGVFLHVPDGLTLVVFMGSIALGLASYMLTGAALVALAGTAEGARALVTLVKMICIALCLIAVSVMSTPESQLAAILSCLPFSAPIFISLRISQISVSTWELILALGTQFITCWLLLKLCAAMFEAKSFLIHAPRFWAAKT